MGDEYRGLLARYHDRELAEDAAQAVEQHLAGCPACRAEMLALRSLSMTLGVAAEARSAATAEAFWAAVQPRLGVQRAEPPWRSWLPGLLLLALQGILGVAGLIVTFGSWLERFAGFDAGLPDLSLSLLPLPGLPVPVLPLPDVAIRALLSVCLFASAGVLYLIWLGAWWSRHHAEPDSSRA